MSETKNSKVALPAGIQPVAKPVGNVPAVATPPQPPPPVVQPVAAAPKPPSLFGGHRGGGKKRADGLVAGSPEAIAADKEKDRIRVAEKRAKKITPLPPPLPGAENPAPNASAPLAGDAGAVPGAETGAVPGVPVGLLPTFVAWTATMIGRPVKLLTKIIDRIRCSKLMEKIRSLGFDKETEREAEQKIAFKQAQVDDFNAALSNCAVIELNKRRVPGAQHSHWFELAMAGAELVNCHLDTVDFLERKILEKAEREKLVQKN